VTLLNCVDEVLVEGLFEITTLSPPFDLKVVGLGLVKPFTPFGNSFIGGDLLCSSDGFEMYS
jgi:hypothetical protein